MMPFTNHPVSVRHWIYVITGFTQNRGTKTKLTTLWKTLSDQLSSPRTVVCLRPWNANWEAEAEFVHRLSGCCENTTIDIFGYSWGGGWGFPRFASAIGRRGHTVDHAVLSDPVYRHWYRAGNWRAFVPWSKIRVPRNVRLVESFVQRNDWPRGHRLIASCSETTIKPPTITGGATGHAKMDNNPLFLSRCIAVAPKGVFPRPWGGK